MDDVIDRPAAAAAAAAADSPELPTRSPPAQDDVGVVSVDTPCRACGYSLLALPTTGRCPECGLEVAASFGPDILARWDPIDIRRRATAMRVVLWATFALVLAAVVMGVAGSMRSPFRDQRDILWWVRVQAAVETLASTLLAVAHWRLGAPLPTREVAGRRLYRAAAATTLLLQLGSLTSTVLLTTGQPVALGGPLLTVRMALGIAMVVGLAAAYVGFFLFAGGLARLIPRDGLARAARWLTWICVPAILDYVALAVVMSVWEPVRLSNLQIVAMVAAALFLVAFLGGTAAAAVLLHRLRVHFTRAANRAVAGPARSRLVPSPS